MCRLHLYHTMSICLKYLLGVTLQAAAEYYRLMLPPWDANGGSGDWVKSAVRS